MENQVLNIERMQHLQELGLDTSKASMHYWIIRNGEYSQEVGEYVFSKEPSYITLKLHPYEFMSDAAIRLVEDIPTFTLQDVLDALPDFIDDYSLIIDIAFGIIRYDNLTWDSPILKETCFNDEDKYLIDAAYELLVWCAENKFVETNKNE